jgi:hypothetical protein
MKLTILLVLATLTAGAQTNLPPKIVTRADVVAGLTTLSNQVSTLKAAVFKMQAKMKADGERNFLLRQAGEMSNQQYNDAYFADQNQFNPVIEYDSRRISALRAQIMIVKERYAGLLAGTNSVATK